MPAPLAIISISSMVLLSAKTSPRIPFNPYTSKNALRKGKRQKIYLPAHGADIGWVECSHVETLLKHLLELDSKWEGNLSGDEALENWANHLECHHVDYWLKILLQHIVHHVWVAHQVHSWRFHNTIQKSICLVAEVRFADLQWVSRDELCKLSQPLTAYHCFRLPF